MLCDMVWDGYSITHPPICSGGFRQLYKGIKCQPAWTSSSHPASNSSQPIYPQHSKKPPCSKQETPYKPFNRHGASLHYLRPRSQRLQRLHLLHCMSIMICLFHMQEISGWLTSRIALNEPNISRKQRRQAWRGASMRLSRSRFRSWFSIYVVRRGSAIQDAKGISVTEF